MQNTSVYKYNVILIIFVKLNWWFIFLYSYNMPEYIVCTYTYNIVNSN